MFSNFWSRIWRQKQQRLMGRFVIVDVLSDLDRMSADELAQLFGETGTSIGFGNYRPAR